MFKENLTKDVIERTLAPVAATFEQTVVPQKVELLPNNTYAPNYAWMYSFEKRLKYRIQDLLGYRLIYNQERILFGAGGAISEAVSNAFVHGHKKDITVPISIWVAVSKKGLGFAISDRGAGFNVDRILQSFKDGDPFYHIAGNGFSLFHKSADFQACYLNNGRELSIVYHFNPDVE